MSSIIKWIFLLSSLAAGCQSQYEIPKAEIPPPSTKQMIPVTVLAIAKDGSYVKGAHVMPYYLKPKYLPATTGWKTDGNGRYTIQLEAGAKVRIDLTYPTGQRVSKEITVSSQEKEIRFVEPKGMPSP
ncbi:hypothetical protein [Lihuaxuella thermophila]|uniref:Carboxypeptidase regulatory-like domain-containing protein n=1 Tax=Lihuaxuella thermophila TaxID=1173111 RepID=A0A1H8EQR8_9BACL|nr:hypothetical protein [Lihuaxuella thermophila]SEN21931.1 hypothetical protein SAMN05444955_107125 [Lihuaxuella thermophila]